MTDEQRRHMVLEMVQVMMSHKEMGPKDFFAVLNSVLTNSISVLVDDNTARRKILEAFCKDARKGLNDIISNENKTLN